METPIKVRLSKPMPKDWKKIQKFCVLIGLILTSISGSFIAVFPDSIVLQILTAISATFTAVGAGLPALAIEDK